MSREEIDCDSSSSDAARSLPGAEVRRAGTRSRTRPSSERTPSRSSKAARSCSRTRRQHPPGSTGGLLHDDTRFLSRWELSLEGQPLSLLKSGTVDYYSASFFLSNPDLADIRANGLAVRRLRFVGNGVLEQIAVVNASLETVRFELRLACGATSPTCSR